MKIFCIGRNYADHAKELNNPIPENPVIFMKPPTAVLRSKDFYYPDFSKNVHFEGELVVKIDKNGKKISPSFANRYYSTCTIGFDLTARDLQQDLKTKGLPWEVAKGFDGSAPIGEFISFDEFASSGDTFEIYQNHVLVQKGHIKDMLFSIDELISHISKFFTLQKGDLIFTGTPAGVGSLEIGDIFEGKIGSKVVTSFHVK